MEGRRHGCILQHLRCRPRLQPVLGEGHLKHPKDLALRWPPCRIEVRPGPVRLQSLPNPVLDLGLEGPELLGVVCDLRHLQVVHGVTERRVLTRQVDRVAAEGPLGWSPSVIALLPAAVNQLPRQTPEALRDVNPLDLTRGGIHHGV